MNRKTKKVLSVGVGEKGEKECCSQKAKVNIEYKDGYFIGYRILRIQKTIEISSTTVKGIQRNSHLLHKQSFTTIPHNNR